MQKNSRNSRGKSSAMETYFYPIEFSFSFTRLFLWILRKIPSYLFLCPFSISRIMIAKKSRNSRWKSRAMETHFYPIEFFFSFTSFFLWTCRKIPCLFLCLLSISRIMNAKKKNSKFEREVKSNGNTLVPHTFFLFLSLDCSYEHSERFPPICFYALLL